MTTLLSALAGAERIFEVMDTQPEVDQGSVTLVGAEKDVYKRQVRRSPAERP